LNNLLLKIVRFNEYLIFSLVASLFIAGCTGSRTSSPSGLLHDFNVFFGSWNIKKNTVISEILQHNSDDIYISETVHDRRKVITKHWFVVWIALSECAIINHLQCPDIKSELLFQNPLYKCETLHKFEASTFTLNTGCTHKLFRVPALYQNIKLSSSDVTSYCM